MTIIKIKCWYSTWVKMRSRFSIIRVPFSSKSQSRCLQHWRKSSEIWRQYYLNLRKHRVQNRNKKNLKILKPKECWAQLKAQFLHLNLLESTTHLIHTSRTWIIHFISNRRRWILRCLIRDLRGILIKSSPFKTIQGASPL